MFTQNAARFFTSFVVCFCGGILHLCEKMKFQKFIWFLMVGGIDGNISVQVELLMLLLLLLMLWSEKKEETWKGSRERESRENNLSIYVHIYYERFYSVFLFYFIYFPFYLLIIYFVLCEIKFYMKTSGGASLLSFSSSNVTVLERVGRGSVAEERPLQLKFILPKVVISTTLGCGAKNSVAMLLGTKYSSPCVN